MSLRGWPGSSAYWVIKWHWWKINQFLRLYKALPGNEMVKKKCCLSWIEAWTTSCLQRKPQERSAEGLETKAWKHNGSLEKRRPSPILSGFVLSRKRWSRIIPKEWKLLAASSKSMHRAVRATTRSGYVISCNLIGSELNQNIDLTAKGLSSTEMSNRETSKQIAVECFGWNVPWRKVTAIRSRLIEIILCVIAFDLRISRC